ncbi:unnamed protein product [Larinioides sclopetarius]|uniref:Uncharacterized protein n=1 Tax=Larinioides sclopetarius TaxID=280406 RepID=A0AAV1Z6Z4_9ARAC
MTTIFSIKSLIVILGSHKSFKKCIILVSNLRSFFCTHYDQGTQYFSLYFADDQPYKLSKHHLNSFLKELLCHNLEKPFLPYPSYFKVRNLSSIVEIYISAINLFLRGNVFARI